MKLYSPSLSFHNRDQDQVAREAMAMLLYEYASRVQRGLMPMKKAVSFDIHIEHTDIQIVLEYDEESDE